MSHNDLPIPYSWADQHLRMDDLHTDELYRLIAPEYEGICIGGPKDGEFVRYHHSTFVYARPVWIPIHLYDEGVPTSGPPMEYGQYVWVNGQWLEDGGEGWE